MKRSGFSEEKIISILKELEAGAKAAVKHKQDSAHGENAGCWSE
jgi:hypothetical protein